MSGADAGHLPHVRPDKAPAQPDTHRVNPAANAFPAEDNLNGRLRERELLDLLPDAYLATNLSGRILEANAAASDLFGCSTRELRGSSLFDFVAPEDADRVAAILTGEDAAASQEPLEARLWSTTGRSILAELRAFRQSHGRRRVYLRWFVRDVTHQRGTERALRDQAERYRQLATRRHAGSRRGVVPSGEEGNRRTFLRLFLHDVRSPLAVVVALVETLLRDEAGLPAEQRRELLTRAVKNLEHIHHLLAEVVDIERLEQRQVAVRLEPTDVRTVVERMVAAVGEGDRPIEFYGSVSIVHTDASLVERAVSKLLDNALTHTPPATGIRVGVEDVGDGVIVTVEDEGPGVPDDMKESIFEAFDRGQAPATTGGFGLGLALVRHIVHVLGGKIWVEDRRGGGASFRLFLPSGPV